MYDDGENGGDETAGDGVYTNNRLEPVPDSDFFEQYPLPAEVEVRVMVKDADGTPPSADAVLRWVAVLWVRMWPGGAGAGGGGRRRRFGPPAAVEAAQDAGLWDIFPMGRSSESFGLLY